MQSVFLGVSKSAENLNKEILVNENPYNIYADLPTLVSKCNELLTQLLDLIRKKET